MPRFIDLTDTYLRCRTYGHAWDEALHPLAARSPIAQPSPGQGDKSSWWQLFLRCTRCTTTRTDTIDARGDVVRRRYDYPTGYKYAGTGQLKRPVLRLELKVRVHRSAKKMIGGVK